MSGALAMFASSASGAVVAAWLLALEDVSVSTPGVRTVSITIDADGSMSCVGAASAPDWFAPIAAGVGSVWSVRVSIAAAIDTTSGGSALDTWHGLGTAKTFSLQNSSTHVEGIGSATVEFSPDAGFSVATTCILVWNVGYRA